MPSHEQQQQLDELKSQIASTLAALPEKDVLAQRNDWQKSALASFPEPTREGLTAYYPLDSDLKDASGFHLDGKAVRGEVVYEEGAVAKGADFSPETQVSFGNAGDFDRAQALLPGVWARPSGVVPVKVIEKHDCRRTLAGVGDLPTTSLTTSDARSALRTSSSAWPTTGPTTRLKSRPKTESSCESPAPPADRIRRLREGLRHSSFTWTGSRCRRQFSKIN